MHADSLASYEWGQTDEKYGIVSYPNVSQTDLGSSGTPTPITPEFYSLQR